MCKNAQVVDEKEDARCERISAAIRARREVLARQGTIVASWKTHQGRRLGPYFRLAFREAGRQVSIYLGACEALVGKVREVLDKIQAPARLARTMRKARIAGKAALRACRARAKLVMANWGLYFRGSNVFGWRRLVPKIPSAKALLEGTERKLLRGIDTNPKDWDLAPKAWFERDLEKLAFRTLAGGPPKKPRPPGPHRARPARRPGGLVRRPGERVLAPEAHDIPFSVVVQGGLTT